MRPDQARAVAEQAHRQLGHVTSTQLAALGVSAKARRQLVACGYRPIGRHTYRLPAIASTFEAEAMAATLDLGGVATAGTAAQLHGLRRALHGEAIEVLVTRRPNRHLRDGWVVHSTTNLPADDIVTVGGIPCTGVARTFLTLAAQVPEIPADLIRTAIGDAAREGKVSDAWLWWRLERLRCRGRNGVTAMEEILRIRQRLGPTESWLEHAFLVLLDRSGLPLPAVQVRVRRKGAFVARVDFAYLETGVIIEVEGFGAHRDQRTEDEARRRALVLAGHRVLVFTYDEVVSHPVRVVADVRSALTATLAA